MKVSVDIETFRPRTLVDYAALCGWALARAHAKAGDPATIAGYLGSSDRFDRAMTQYALAYADIVERDFAAFLEAIRSGRMTVETGDFNAVEFLP
jgi:predicted alpha/beta hydrolase